MSQLREVLKNRRLECLEEINTLRAEIGEIKAVTNMLDASEKGVAPKKKNRRNGSKTKGGILEAIKNGCGTPTKIQSYMTKHLGLDPTTAAISTSLTTMKNNGEVEHEKHIGWVMPKEKPAEPAPMRVIDKRTGDPKSPAIDTGKALGGATMKFQSAEPE